MSKRLIDANELISAMYYYEYNEGGLTAYDAQDIINKAPTIEPKRTDGRKCGEWIDREQCQVDEDGYDVAICSNCKEEITIDPRHDNYCPNCGAQMKGADDE